MQKHMHAGLIFTYFCIGKRFSQGMTNHLAKVDGAECCAKSSFYVKPNMAKRKESQTLTSQMLSKLYGLSIISLTKGCRFPSGDIYVAPESLYPLQMQTLHKDQAKAMEMMQTERETAHRKIADLEEASARQLEKLQEAESTQDQSQKELDR